jgi:hypothetical protein
MVERLPPPTPAGPVQGDRPRVIEDAGRWREFDQILAEVREGFADLPPEVQQALVDKATAAVREERRRLGARPTRPVLELEEFTAADLAAILAAVPPPNAPEDDMAAPES